MDATYNPKKTANGVRKNGLRRMLLRPCVGHRKLLNWEMAQYRKAVDDYRRRLSEMSEKAVTRSEAEELFCAEQGEETSLQWRKEYCGRLCEHRSSCPIAEFYRSAA